MEYGINGTIQHEKKKEATTKKKITQRGIAKMPTDKLKWNTKKKF